MADPAAYLAAATRAARRAGELIRAGRPDPADVQTKGNVFDLVTAVDHAAEREIIAELRLATPDAAILGEEGQDGTGAPAAGDPLGRFAELWLVDPLDGTANFVHGVPFAAVSIALAQRGQLQTAVVYDPNRDELFAAARGQGATLNGRPVRVEPAAALAQAMLATGFSARAWSRHANVEGLRALSPHVRNIRAMGSAALHLAYVACGRLSGFWEVLLAPWDMAAGVLLVQEAGGRVTDTLGRPYELSTQHIVATCGPIHAETLFILHEAGATGYDS